MNRMIKGSVVGAAGVALLMGGFGTYATWTDDAVLGESSVSAGQLDIEAGDVVWDDATTVAPADWSANTTLAVGDLLVPGDVVTRTQAFTVTGTGKNLAGTIALNKGTQDLGGFTEELLDVSFEVEVASSNPGLVKVAGTDGDFTFEAPFNTATLTAVVTYAFDQDSTSAQQAQLATATLSDASITITQTR